MKGLRATFVGLLLLALPFSGAANAQTKLASSTWDIVGLKLGMTVDEANAALHAYNAGILSTINYEVDDVGTYVNPVDLFKGDDRETPKFKAPVQIFALLPTHLYGFEGKEVQADSNDSVASLSGEWFRLDFTPTDSGGELYAIQRTVIFPQGDDAKASLPSASSLEASLAAKYGKPTDASDSSYETWMTDVRGRPLSAGSRDFGRCKSGIGQLDAPMPWISQLRDRDTSTSFGELNFTYKDITLAMSGVDGATLDRDNNAGLVLDRLEEPTPLIEADSSDNARYRQCGVQLQFHYVGDPDHVQVLTIRLSDQSRTFSDNGRAKYAADKLAAAGSGQAPATTSF